MRPSCTERQGEPGIPPAPDPVTFLDTFTVAEPATNAPCVANVWPNTQTRAETAPGPGFRGRLELTQADSISAADTVPVLKQLAALVSWAQAQQALLIHRIENYLRRDIEESLGPVEGSVALSAAAAEVSAALNLPHMSALALVSESDALCTVNRSTHARLSQGTISYRHAQRILEEVQTVPECEAPQFEDELLALADGRTCAQFTAKARRLRESRWPETISVRHRQALDLRRVCLDPKPDGMAELSALVAAEKGQAIFNALTASARAARAAGDHRTLDQLRTDVFTSLVMQGSPPAGCSPFSAQPPPAGHFIGAAADPGRGSAKDPLYGDARVTTGLPQQASYPGTSSSGPAVETAVPPPEDLSGIHPEIMVLIDASTLFGSDDGPAELNGYGPISAEAARRLARQAGHWTGLVKDSSSGEILAVGRRRKVPAGLRRWLQARDGTCRFPGCRVSTFRTEVDHTVPWGQGGATEHGNLSNLCPKHHRLKTLGLWKACQPQPGKLNWVSPLGRQYSTEAQLDFAKARVTAAPATRADGTGRREDLVGCPSGDEDPPPF